MSKGKFYTTERNIQIVLSLLKANGIKKVIASPGTTNFSLVGSMQNDPYFEMYSSVDERSAAYMACGMAAESGVPVVLSCTGSTASRNYYPGLTEAFYRKLPVLAITSHQGCDRIGQLMPQNIDRRNQPKDIVNISIDLPIVKDERDEIYVTREVNKAILELSRNGGGPVHINITTIYSRDFSVKELPVVRVMRRYCAWDELPVMPKGRIGVFVGSHMRFSKIQVDVIERFCATHDAIIICDHTSGYYGRYKLLPTLIQLQQNANSPLEPLDLIIHIGEVCAATFSGTILTKEIWRVSEDGEVRDPYGKLTNVFQMPEEVFFMNYGKDECNRHDFIDACRKACDEIYREIPELPFSNIWTAMQLSSHLPKGSLLHISASNTRRCWNMFPLPEGVESACNVGCCGIDGCTSTLVGASLINPNRLCFGVTGDLAFFYDLNVLGNRHVGKNLRILLINNGIGGEFKLSVHFCNDFGEEANKYMAAAGHFGNKSPKLVKHFAEDLGYRYLSANNKEEFLSVLAEFTDPKITDTSIIFEVFTRPEDESDALYLMSHIRTDVKVNMRNKLKDVIKSVAGNEGIEVIKGMLKK